MWITKLIEVVILEIEIDDLVGTDTLLTVSANRYHCSA